MAAGGANFLLFLLFGGFVAFPLGSAIAILMRHRSELSNRITWAIISVIVPSSLVFLAMLLSHLDIVRDNIIMGFTVMSLFVIAFFSPFIVLDFFTKRFPLKV